MDRATLHRWMEIGIEPEIIDIAVKNSIAVEKVEAYARTPKTRQQIEKFIRKEGLSSTEALPKIDSN